MATRALIGYFDDDRVLTTTYNHYDGYPDHLGKILNKYFSNEELAKKIAGTGYISYIDDDGTINSKYDEEPNRLKLSGDFDEEDMLEIAGKVDEYGGDYGYVWHDGEWHTVKNRGIRTMADDLQLSIGARTNPDNDTMQEEIKEADYNSKWNQFRC